MSSTIFIDPYDTTRGPSRAAPPSRPPTLARIPGRRPRQPLRLPHRPRQRPPVQARSPRRLRMPASTFDNAGNRHRRLLRQRHRAPSSSSAPEPRHRRRARGAWKRHAQRRKQEREQAHRAFLREPATPHARGSATSTTTGQMPTVSEAARLLLDHHCTIENRRRPPRRPDPRAVRPARALHLEALKHVIRAARVLDAAGHVVLDELAKTKQTKRLDERLPDKHAAAFGGIA